MQNKNNIPAIQQELMSPGISARLESRLGEKAGTFITSVLDICGEDKALSACDPKLVVKEALKSAGLDLPINKNLGFAYVIVYKGAPQFQMGYKGYIQLAIRTGQYKHLNSGIIYEGETIIEDRIKGTLQIGGKKKSDKAIGYFCYMELINGFEKAVVWTREKVEAHGKRFSKSFNKSFSPWKSDFDAMALKTMVMQLIPKFGPMTIEMSQAMSSDMSDTKSFNQETRIMEELEQKANHEIIDIPSGGTQEPNDKMTDAEKAEIIAQEQAEAMANKNAEPGF